MGAGACGSYREASNLYSLYDGQRILPVNITYLSPRPPLNNATTPALLPLAWASGQMEGRPCSGRQPRRPYVNIPVQT